MTGGTTSHRQVPDGGYAQIDGLEIDRISLDGARDAIRRATIDPPDQAFQVATVNLDFLALARRDEKFRAALQSASLTLADGMPIVWLARYLRSPLPGRVTGIDLVMWLLDGGLPSAKLFLLGSTPGSLKKTWARAKVHGSHVVGAASPDRSCLTSPDLSALLVQRINASGANVLLVALGAPLQETWIADWRADLRVAVAIGVGCSLDVAAGNLARAPEHWQRAGLEWLYRLTNEPQRLWRRYLLRDLPLFVALFLRMLFSAPQFTRPSRATAKEA